jgi:hypothetical protein
MICKERNERGKLLENRKGKKGLKMKDVNE